MTLSLIIESLQYYCYVILVSAYHNWSEVCAQEKFLKYYKNTWYRNKFDGLYLTQPLSKYTCSLSLERPGRSPATEWQFLGWNRELVYCTRRIEVKSHAVQCNIINTTFCPKLYCFPHTNLFINWKYFLGAKMNLLASLYQSVSVLITWKLMKRLS